MLQAIDAFRGLRRSFGTVDCCQLAATVVAAMTGEDFRARFAAYASQEEAEAILANAGGMEGLLESVLGESKHVSRANVGDVVSIDSTEGIGCGICVGVLTATIAPEGLVFCPTIACRAAWSV